MGNPQIFDSTSSCFFTLLASSDFFLDTWNMANLSWSKDSKTPNVVETEDVKKYSHDRNASILSWFF